MRSLILIAALVIAALVAFLPGPALAPTDPARGGGGGSGARAAKHAVTVTPADFTDSGVGCIDDCM